MGLLKDPVNAYFEEIFETGKYLRAMLLQSDSYALADHLQIHKRSWNLMHIRNDMCSKYFSFPGIYITCIMFKSFRE